MRARLLSVVSGLAILVAVMLAPAAVAGPRAAVAGPRADAAGPRGAADAALQPFSTRLLSLPGAQAPDMIGFSTSYSHGVTVAGAALGQVGANSEQGYVVVYEQPAGAMVTTRLSAADGGEMEGFGYSTGISGDTIVASAPYQQEGANVRQGAVYVFIRSADGSWIQQAKLTGSNGDIDNTMGIAVAISGDTLVVGTPGRTVDGLIARGGAYVFTRSHGVWTERAFISPADGDTGDCYGASVALQGNTMLLTSGNANDGKGVVCVYTGSGGSWTEQGRLTASDGTDNDTFGWSVALDGDTAMVGAPTANDRDGAVYVFNRAGGSWSQTARLALPSTGDKETFGTSVDFSGDLAAIGAPGHAELDPVTSTYYIGAVYLYTRSAGTWTPAQTITEKDHESTIYYGASVAVEGNTVAFGDKFRAIDGEHTGAVWMYMPSVGPDCSVAGPGGKWQVTPPTLTFNGAPSAGGAPVGSTQYWIDGVSSDWTNAPALTVTTEGVNHVRYRAVDVNGTAGPVSAVTVRLDTHAPQARAGAASVSHGRAARLAYTVRDEVPGCGRAVVRLTIRDARGRVLRRASSLPVTVNARHKIRVRTGRLARGTYRVVWRATDAAGNRQPGNTVSTLIVR